MEIRKKEFLAFFLLLCSVIFSCRKDTVISDPNVKLTFSDDTILFDTVFTAVGSASRQLKIYNTYNSKLLISSLGLARGTASQFRLNVDGLPGKSFTNIEIPAGDSIFVILEVTVKPNDANSPMVITDSIIFETNGNLQDVDLVAWGQDAHYITPNLFYPNLPPLAVVCTTEVTWPNDKPYVIYGYAVVDSGGKLNIDPGVRIHFYKNGGLWVYKDGSLMVNGTKEEPVTFQGSRLEYEYRDVPGQWDRIWITEGSKSSVFNYAIIKNGFIGIQAQTLVDGLAKNYVTINNTVIQNMTGMGLYTQFFRIRANNLVISNCGNYNVALTMGGNYSFRHSTFANYWNFSNRQTPLLFIGNYNDLQTLPLDSAFFGNCIIHGSLNNEIGLDAAPTGTFNFKFDHCLLKVDESTVNTNTPNYNVVYKNANPGFKDYYKQIYELDAGSFSIDKGDNSITNLSPAIQSDILGNSRISGSAADLGAYEWK